MSKSERDLYYTPRTSGLSPPGAVIQHARRHLWMPGGAALALRHVRWSPVRVVWLRLTSVWWLLRILLRVVRGTRPLLLLLLRWQLLPLTRIAWRWTAIPVRSRTRSRRSTPLLLILRDTHRARRHGARRQLRRTTFRPGKIPLRLRWRSRSRWTRMSRRAMVSCRIWGRIVLRVMEDLPDLRWEHLSWLDIDHACRVLEDLPWLNAPRMRMTLSRRSWPQISPVHWRRRWSLSTSARWLESAR